MLSQDPQYGAVLGPDPHENVDLDPGVEPVRSRIRGPYPLFRFDKKCGEINFVFNLFRGAFCLNYCIFF
jgi:hypothetical protein